MSSTPNDTNLEVAAFTWGIGNLAYAPTELIEASQAVGVAAFVAGWAVAALVYFTKINRWMGPESEGRVDRVIGSRGSAAE